MADKLGVSTDRPANPSKGLMPKETVVTIEARTIRQVMWRVMPLLTLSYFVAFLDRINISVAALTMNKDLGFSPGMFGFGAGLFFLSYFFFEVPSNVLLQKFGARRWIARIMFSWGIVSGAMAFVHGQFGFYALRLLLGVAEAGFFPGVLFYLSYWFPEIYRGRVFAYFLASVPLSSVIGFPISAALLGMDGLWGMHGWQWLFIIEALMAVLLSVVVFYCLTDYPRDAKWLSTEQRGWLEHRLVLEAERRQGARGTGVWVALMNPRVLGFCIIHFCTNLALYGFGFFLPQIVKPFGLSNLQTGFVAAVPFVLGALGMVYWGRRADHFSRRWSILIPMALAALGFAGAAAFSNPYWMLASMSLASFGLLGYSPVFWTLPTAVLAGAAAAVAIAAINSVGNLAGFFGPTIVGYLRDLTGSYSTGLAASAAVLVVAWVLTAWLTREPPSLAPAEIAERKA
ncbi:MAG: MFS transporter [Janthinobacterium lividum]